MKDDTDTLKSFEIKKLFNKRLVKQEKGRTTKYLVH